MKKGKTLTTVVLALEIATIAILHAVKINQAGKSSGKEVTRTISASQPESRSRSTYSFAVFK